MINIGRHADFLSIPLRDGSRLQLGECFTVEATYPFFSDGEENYNARLCWDDEQKTMYYDIYPVSDRVRGCTCGDSISEVDWSKIVRRAAPDPENTTE